MNTLRTGLLLAVMTALFLGVGYLLGGPSGALFAFFAALVLNGIAYWNSDKLVLRMYKAQEVGHDEYPDFYRLVQSLSQRADLPMPKVYIIKNPQPNAFATGRNPENAAVAATTGLLELLSRDELEGVIAHELTHIKNRDTLTMTMTAVLAGAISMLAYYALFFGRGRSNPLGIVGVLLIFFLAPLAAMLVQMAISRTREYAADKGGAEISGKPLGLASALRRIQAGVKTHSNPAAEKNPASAPLFIINPLHGQRADKLFATHPATENRVAALEAIAGVMGRDAFTTDEVNPVQRKTRSALNPFGRGPREL